MPRHTIPIFLRPEVMPFTSVEIVRVPTHFVPWNQTHGLALCGRFVEAEEVCAGRDEPTCPACLAELAKTVEEAFGHVVPGEAVHTTYGDPLKDYTPKARR